VPLLRLSRWSLAVTTAAMPLYVVRWRAGPLPTTLLEVLILFTAGVYLLGLLLRQVPWPARTSLEIPMALLIVAAGIGVFVAPNHRDALGIFRAYFLEPMAVYLVAVAVLTSLAAVENLIAAWAAGAVLFAADEVFRFGQALAANVLHPGHAQAALDINPNSVALFLEPLIGMAAGIALFSTGRRRVAAVAVGLVLGLAEISTLSRGGLLALAAMTAVALLTIPSVRLRIALGAAALLSVGAIFALPVLGPRVESTLNQNGTLSVRLQIWVTTLRMLRDHPVFGAGLDSYQQVMAPYRASDPRLAPQPYPHDILLTSWTELGLLGMVTFLYLLVYLVVSAFRAFARATGLERELMWGTGTAFVMLAVHGLVDSPYWKNDLSVEFWMLAAIEVAVLRLLRAAPAPAPAPARP
jgi:O-antigen ligase